MENQTVRSVVGDFLGQRMILKTEENQEFAEQVIQFVQDRFSESKQRCGAGTSGLQVAILAMLDLTEEYLKAKDRAEAYRSALTEKNEELFERLGLGQTSH